MNPDAVGYFEHTFGLSGKVALVTGGREGIGAATAISLAMAGARVAVTSRTREGLEEVVAAVQRTGSEALPLSLELRDVEQVQDVVRQVHQHFGRLDILVNNAGIAIRADSLTYPQSAFDEVFEVNLRASFYAAQAAALLMIDSGGGRIINLSSVFAHTAMPHRAAYAASKAGLEQMTKILAVEWAPHHITVNCIAPATIDTPTRAHLFPTPEALAERLRLIPVGRLGVPEDVAPAVLLLASRAGDFITGSTIMVDGGMSID
ncbi:MAG: SDR family NAD(P)-dependent oxidoreductase [Candidatus Dormibacteraceae bacterium]